MRAAAQLRLPRFLALAALLSLLCTGGAHAALHAGSAGPGDHEAPAASDAASSDCPACFLSGSTELADSPRGLVLPAAHRSNDLVDSAPRTRAERSPRTTRGPPR